MNFKKFFYLIFGDNPVIRFIDHPFLVTIIPAIVGLYYGTLDIWGDDWKWVTNYKGIHELTFSTLAIVTIVTLILKGISQSLRSKVRARQNTLTEALLDLFNKLVKKKRDRFYNKAKHLSPRKDVFNLITHPDDQLGHALDETKNFLIEGLGIDSKNIGITIIQGDPHAKTKKWWYFKKCDSQKQHTRPQDLMSYNSTASYCYKTGDSIFLPDIRKGIKEGVFYESTRSRNGKLGSIFCKPVRITVKNRIYVYIFTIAVFGQNVCSPIDEDDCRACERVFDEIADRIELELYLYSMKQYRYKDGTVKGEARENAQDINA
ncbi:hypothetical protein [Microbulbifer epialgicus]|uniref:GAF domain-containing protein n=1 Tax=Microbulbifer epialgicus TaxID=393907 RepID=A0ABV4P7U7_9GAMM